jgi:hypothetical protein
MKKILVLLIAISSITSSAFAKIIIRQECCNSECTRKCWVIILGSENIRTSDVKQQSFDISKAVVMGDSLVLTMTNLQMSKRDFVKLVKEGIMFKSLKTISKKEIEENKISGAKSEFSIQEQKGTVLISKDENIDPNTSAKIKWPRFKITITIKITRVDK